MMRNARMISIGLFAGIYGSVAFGPSGCVDSDNEAKACDSCPGQFAYFCQVPSSNNIVCANDDAQASAVCPEGWSGKIDCSSDTGGQQPWEPGLFIQYDRPSGIYHVERELIDVLTVDGLVLVTQDSARLTELEDGYFQVDGVASDDLAAYLGFQDGDIPLAVNEFLLRSWDGYATAITQLAGVSTFTITIEREGQVLTHHYEVF